MSSDTAGSEFAGLLRELKDRSGLSYGTLAKRLHMSTSTLHRYCGGDVVPPEYAPVERFARLCKASPDELVALHRSWVLADVNRPRKGGDPGSRTPAGPVAAAAPETVAGEAVVGEAAAPVDRVDGEAPATSGARPPESSRPSERLLDVPATPSEVTGPFAAPAEVSVAQAPPRRPRRAVLAGIAVAAVAGAVVFALSLNLSADTGVRGRPVGAASPAPGEAGRTGGGTAAAGPPAASPAPARSASRGVSQGPSRGAGGGPAGAVPEAAGTGAAAGPSAPSPGGAGAAGDQASAAPLTVAAQPHTWESPCGQHYLIDKPPTEVGPPPLERDAPAWVAASGAVAAGEQYVTLTLQGTGKETVVLDSMTVRTAGKRTPLPWNDYAMGYPGVGCGSGVPTRSFTVALDAARPAFAPVAGERNFPFMVSESTPEVFYVKADASAYDVSWYLELAWSSGSRHGTVTIDHNGKPFRTSGHNGRPGYEFPLGGEGWVPAGSTS
ncbi:helix-turn-helix domain-containing protein [Streptomyces sp. NPDC001568]|uniref:helix-turn-helix domain-containing protein n=1 Tax=Streptomyces sp. NPDC001568 TaxID=3364588 RepID=UPI00368782C5